MPPHLPRIDHRHELESCQCGRCGKDLIKIGEDITEQLDVEPAKFFVRRHFVPNTPAVPVNPLLQHRFRPLSSMVAVGLLTWILISKYQDHLPLYRLEQIAARDNIVLARFTLAEWVGRTGVALQPVADRLSEILLERGTLHTDETPVQQLDPGRGKTKRAYL